jgi:triacylglycerol lipase
MASSVRKAGPLENLARLAVDLSVGGSRAGADGAFAGEDLVVLLHGLGRTPLSMRRMAASLARSGYRVWNIGYPSRTRTVPELAEDVAGRIGTLERGDDGPARIHFVGQSMGNILIRWLIVHRRPPRLGRIVMLAPPNRGSRLADRLAPWLTGLLRPLPDLRTTSESVSRTIATPEGIEIGVIAAQRDPKVRVDETHLDGQADHVVVPGGHSFIMARPDVAALTERFLRTGRFSDAREK